MASSLTIAVVLLTKSDGTYAYNEKKSDREMPGPSQRNSYQQDRTRRSSRRVSPIGRPVQRNEVKRSTTRIENTVHQHQQQQQQQRSSSSPPPPAGAPPSSPVQPAAPPSSPPKPSPPVAAAPDDEWQNNDAQPPTQESQGGAEGQYDPWAASDAAQAQNSQGPTEGGWKANDAFAPTQHTQGQSPGNRKVGDGTTTKTTEEAKPAEPEVTW
ncbi:hypothetical protein KXW98_008811 [Aspergillus fumigatus]|uniref:Uncharacterized protein n=1 Tax=Aspergillus fumigatus TaxID=746128 RepID=A0A229XZD4_ASPFM|nr:hypothetical protein CNMCM8714_002014 [Aspergillus fumigatus]KAF4259363.1 hypothetical protein CNMCM8057_002840 [Aspergillus fumigatus]KAF4266942.1 hypothetical protein CNMCM8812_002500 [Aspergillus fumigatus]KAF4279855.1 hypothetical protein CNMCM8689_002995 [Aspergillus fumigatus]KAF4289218.1 hypothetical protein CNMCM8686_002944 [Aspergillus fumigatus]